MADDIFRHLEVNSFTRLAQRWLDVAWRLDSAGRLVESKPIELQQLVLDTKSAFVVSFAVVVNCTSSAG